MSRQAGSILFALCIALAPIGRLGAVAPVQPGERVVQVMAERVAIRQAPDREATVLVPWIVDTSRQCSRCGTSGRRTSNAAWRRARS